MARTPSQPRRWPIGLTLLVAGAVAAIVVVVVLVEGSKGKPDDAQGPLTVTVDLTHPGPAIPRSFLGLSIEYQSVPAYFGPGARPNRAFVRRVAALGAAQRAPVALRIGGNSSDESWWNPARRPRPHGVLYDLGPAWVASLATGQARLGAPVTLGLNLALDDPGNALSLVRAVRARLRTPGVASLEIGNEPDLFTHARTFRVGRLIVHRPRQRLRYSPARYVAETQRYLAALSSNVRAPRPRFAVGGFASASYFDALAPLVDSRTSNVDELVAHSYAITACNGETPVDKLRAQLLTDGASRGLTKTVAPYLAAARSRGLPVRVSELNSAVCGGVRGVSDTFTAALWAPDALFALANAGVRQVDMHTWAGAYYAPLVVGRAAGRDVARPRPLYYGLMLFALAAPAGSRLVPVRLTNAGSTRAWATIDPRGALRLLLINRSTSASREVLVRVAAVGGSGRLTLLRAPGIDARDGVTLGGRELSDDGALARPPLGASVSARGRRVRFTLPAASAGLLTLRVASR
jgi:hypothetical protein